MRKLTLLLLFFVLLSFSVQGAKLHGTVYDLNLTTVENAIVEISTTPKQQYLAKTGEYSFDVPIGEYTLKAGKNGLITTDKVKITADGNFIFDLFLLPSFDEEDELLTDLNGLGVTEDKPKQSFFSKYPWWTYVLGLLIFVIGCIRIVKARNKYGDLPKVKFFGRKKKKKPVEEPSYLDAALEIIKKNDGRLTQKELRKKMMHLSEAKVSLIVTELEHKGKIEKIKKGRGNVIIVKE